MTKPCPITEYFPQSSTLAYGCMGLGGSWGNAPYQSEDVELAHRVVDAALSNGINFFDHADIYTMGKAEQVFGEVLKSRPELRDQIILQTKCGIVFEDELGPKRFDFSAKHIEASVEGSLKRLQTDHLDILLLHRPDPLMEPEEVAEAFSRLKQSGKVAHFGVSNVNAQQMQFLQSALDVPLVANQLELHLLKLDWLDDIVLANNDQGVNVNFGSGSIEYCRSHKIQVQSWGSLCQGWLSGRPLDGQPPAVQQTAQRVAQLAAEYQTTFEAIILGFLRRHPASIQPVIGTTDIDRIAACAQVNHIELSREHWYSLYVTARGQELP